VAKANTKTILRKQAKYAEVQAEGAGRKISYRIPAA
jgi:hypothetical protein